MRVLKDDACVGAEEHRQLGLVVMKQTQLCCLLIVVQRECSDLSLILRVQP